MRFNIYIAIKYINIKYMGNLQISKTVHISETVTITKDISEMRLLYLVEYIPKDISNICLSYMKGNTKNNGSILSFVSDRITMSTSLIPLQVVSMPLFIGYNKSMQGKSALGETINLSESELGITFSIPRDAIIGSMTIYFTLKMPININIGSIMTITAQMYSSEETNIFYPIPDIFITFSLINHIPSQNVYKGIITNIDYYISTNTKILYVFSSAVLGIPINSKIVGYAYGGIFFTKI